MLTFFSSQTSAFVSIGVIAVDTGKFSSLESYLQKWQPTGRSNWLNFRILSQQRIRNESPISAAEFGISFLDQGIVYAGSVDWYFTGNYIFEVMAWNRIGLSPITQSQIEYLQSQIISTFLPYVYLNSENSYSLAFPPTWQQKTPSSYEYFASASAGTFSIFSQTRSISDGTLLVSYGLNFNIPNASVISRGIVYENRSKPSYRIDYSYYDLAAGKTVNGALLITLRGQRAILVYLQATASDWAASTLLVEDILRRVGVAQ